MSTRAKRLAFMAVPVGIVVGGAILSACSDDGGDRRERAPAGHSESAERPSFARSAASNIYVIDVATRALERITRNEDAEIATGPAWSVRNQIVFSEERPHADPGRLVLVNADGSGHKVLRTGVQGLYGATWSPDGRRLAVNRLGAGIYVVDPRRHSARRLPGTNERDDAPAWAPDGRTIAFQRQVAATNLDLYEIGVANGRLRRMTRHRRQQINAGWSPDGSRLVLAEQYSNGNWVISTMKRNGTGRELVTDPRVSSQDPAWSPDGTRIALILQGRSRDSLAVIDADGGKPTVITPRHVAAAAGPAWSPDGKRIAFAGHHAVRPSPSGAPGAGSAH